MIRVHILTLYAMRESGLRLRGRIEGFEPHNPPIPANNTIGNWAQGEKRNEGDGLDFFKPRAGIVRRVDDLGRIVIPKEIRRTLRIREGDPLEIYTEKDGGVIFRKYSPMGDLQEFAAQMCESIGTATGRIAAISDRDTIIALAGAPKRELVDKPNSQALDKLMEQRKNYRYQDGDTPIRASDTTEKYHLGVAAPILSQGDLMGCVMLLLQENDKPLAESDQYLAQTAAGFLGRQMEN